MTENQKLKLELLKEFYTMENSVEFCREAYKFIVEDSEKESKDCPPVTVCEKRQDGIYLVYDTGIAQLFTKGLVRSYADNVKYIGIVYDGHAFCVALKSLGEYSLVRDSSECPKKHPLYIEKECDALFDWDCVERTKHIQEVGTDIPLEEGEFIPSLPMLVVMCHWKDRINEALEFVGGDILGEDFYWSSTENSATYAWSIFFSGGTVDYNNYKSYAYVVRAVTAFNV